LLWIEIRRSQGYWLLPLIIGLGIYTPGIDYLPDVVLWPEMGMATLESYVVVAPFAAALAAWLVDRDRRRRIRTLTHSMPGSGFQRDLLSIGTAAFWGLAGYAGVAAWFCGQAALRATWGGPDIGLIVTGALAVVVLAAIGVLVGRLIPGTYSPLLALVATFALTIGLDLFTVISDSGSSHLPIQLLMPLGLNQVTSLSVFHRQPESYVTEVGIWMLALTGVLLAILALLRQRSLVAGIALVAMLAVAGVSAAPLVDPAIEGGPGSVVSIAYTPVCTERGGFEVCVHPAYRQGLDEMADRIAALMGPVQGLDGVAPRWDKPDLTLVRMGDEHGAIQVVGYDFSLLSSVSSIFPVSADGDRVGQRPASQLVVMEWLVLQSGLEIPGEGWSGSFGWPAEVNLQLRDNGDGSKEFSPDDAELAALQPRLDAVLARFTALPDDERRAWLEANWNALRAGTLTLEDLP
jgi:hypothetical protein